MSDISDSGLTEAETRDLRDLAGVMIPADTELGLPAADDPVIFADVLRSLGRDLGDVRSALGKLRVLAGGAFGDLSAARREAVMEQLHAQGGTDVVAMGRVILSCYYRDDRVVLSMGLEPRPPFPKGNVLEQGDWSLLDPVKARPKMWRDAP